MFYNTNVLLFQKNLVLFCLNSKDGWAYFHYRLRSWLFVMILSWNVFLKWWWSIDIIDHNRNKNNDNNKINNNKHHHHLTPMWPCQIVFDSPPPGHEENNAERNGWRGGGGGGGKTEIWPSNTLILYHKSVTSMQICPNLGALNQTWESLIIVHCVLNMFDNFTAGATFGPHNKACNCQSPTIEDLLRIAIHRWQWCCGIIDQCYNASETRTHHISTCFWEKVNQKVCRTWGFPLL